MEQSFADIQPIMGASQLLEASLTRELWQGRSLPKRTSPLMKARLRESARIRGAGVFIVNRLETVVREFPDLEALDPFYHELTAIVSDIGGLKHSLGALNWASIMVRSFASRYSMKAARAGSPDQAADSRREVYGRIRSVVRQIEGDLQFLEEARKKLSRLPSIDARGVTLVVAGCSGVGKSTLVKQISTANPKVAGYPFTTKEIIIGHWDTPAGRVQVVDTPGLLDRPLAERNKIELRAIIALRYLAAAIVFVVDPSETCGFTLDYQLNLYREIVRSFVHTPVMVALNKADLVDAERLTEARKAFGGDVLETIGTRNLGVREVFEQALSAARSGLRSSS